MANESWQLIDSSTKEKNISENERMISMAGGALLGILGLSRIKSHPFKSVLQAAIGGYLLYRGSTGHCAVNEVIGRNTADLDETAARTITIKETVVVNKPKDEVYRFWRKLENLPLFMKHLKKVEETSNTRSHWEAQINDTIGKLEWDAEILDEQEGEFISWSSVPGASVENAGEVRFQSAPGDLVTEVYATISYTPPAGPLGALAAKLFNSKFSSMVREDLKRFKQVIETKESA